MHSERGKYVMSPELAIKREMAYLKQLELMQLIQKSESKKLPPPPTQTSMPVPWPTSGTGQGQIPNSRPPMLSKHPSPILQPGPRPRTMLSRTPLSARGPSLLPKPFFPSQADPRPQSMIVGPRPYMRPQSSGSLPWPKSSHVGSTTGARPGLLPTPSPRRMLKPTIDNSSHKRKEAPTHQFQANNHTSKVQKLFCEVCEVHSTSYANYQMHIMGQKHKAQVKKGKEIGCTNDNSRLYCNLCDIWCMNEFSLKQHLSGKNHTLKVHVAE
ncbi:uncharacterized protein LOC125497999 [Beta vulgaris subsp. vulgaris]|uniref:uncharacterized protein LOC125497999 n=1 Tax=Beta vulgaris subsp. vulgaris TaxID=3555 RepID=UPI00254682F6|nr:uncharacterized protein LOC125497999 [Beta vulgaris subsp. vulgaris]